ncbi:MAG: hypothetical protein GY765_00575 [bacterium]|nr:hypothetical protein [bacterium]
MPKQVMHVTVDWEGTDLKEENILAMKKFNKSFPDVPITHFICPAYFTRGYDAKPIAQEILSVIKSIDEVALHIHCWYSLVKGSGVSTVIKTPTWAADNNRDPGVTCKNGETDYGHPVPLGLYSAEDITKIVTYGRQLLVDNGIIKNTADCVGFRCGGWMTATNVFDGLKGVTTDPFLYDSSAVSAAYCDALFQNLRGWSLPLLHWVSLLWGNRQYSGSSYPYLSNSKSYLAYPKGVKGLYPTDKSISGLEMVDNWIVEVPDTGMLADFVTNEVWKDYIKKASTLEVEEVYLTIGFHQETATSTRSTYPEDKTRNIDKVSLAVSTFMGSEIVCNTFKENAVAYKRQVNAHHARTKKMNFHVG